MSETLEILDEIDSGLYGRVFLARQIKLDRKVAVKIIKADLPHAADAIKHAKALARLSHPNIVAVHGVETVSIDNVGENISAIVMEWLEGETLGVRLGGSKFDVSDAN